MKTIVPVVLAMVIGFVGGIIAAEIIGLAGYVLFDRPSWLRYARSLPFLTPFLCGAVVLLILRIKRN